MVFEKHVGVYESNVKFLEDVSSKTLIDPWVAYVKKEESDGYNVFYSNDMSVSHSSLNVAELLIEKINKLENRIVSLTEEEYESLITLPVGEIIMATAPDGTTTEITYDPTVYYCTYDPDDLTD